MALNVIVRLNSYSFLNQCRNLVPIYTRKIALYVLLTVTSKIRFRVHPEKGHRERCAKRRVNNGKCSQLVLNNIAKFIFWMYVY